MKKQLLTILITGVMLLTGCEEIYEFEIVNDKPTLVVEAYISDKSYNDTKSYPSEGRCFSVKLSETSNVTNMRNQAVSSASVSLEEDNGQILFYTESVDTPGIYYLLNNNFSAKPGTQYRLRVVLGEGKEYLSDWEALVATEVPPMGKIGFEEVEKKVYNYKLGERVVEEEPGIDINIELPEKPNAEPVFYRWDFTPTWIYIAPLASIAQPDYKCWATNELYLSSYMLRKDISGGYRSNILYMGLYRNERTFERLSILITQQAMTERYFHFWNEMQQQFERGGLFDAPPYDLDTNLKLVGSNEKGVSGYFGVVKETAVRWYFDRSDLSYFVNDYLRADCLVDYNGPPADDCVSCLSYIHGNTTNQKPVWWEQ